MPVKRADPASPQIRTEAVNDKKKVSRLKWVALYLVTTLWAKKAQTNITLNFFR